MGELLASGSAWRIGPTKPGGLKSEVQYPPASMRGLESAVSMVANTRMGRVPVVGSQWSAVHPIGDGIEVVLARW